MLVQVPSSPSGTLSVTQTGNTWSQLVGASSGTTTDDSTTEIWWSVVQETGQNVVVKFTTSTYFAVVMAAFSGSSGSWAADPATGTTTWSASVGSGTMPSVTPGHGDELWVGALAENYTSISGPVVTFATVDGGAALRGGYTSYDLAWILAPGASAPTVTWSVNYATSLINKVGAVGYLRSLPGYAPLAQPPSFTPLARAASW